jgi:hypothetical protein
MARRLEVYYEGDYSDFIRPRDHIVLPFYNTIDGNTKINYLQLYPNGSCIATDTPPNGVHIPEINLRPMINFPFNTAIPLDVLSIVCNNYTMIAQYTFEGDTWMRIISPAIIINPEDIGDDDTTGNSDDDPTGNGNTIRMDE